MAATLIRRHRRLGGLVFPAATRTVFVITVAVLWNLGSAKSGWAQPDTEATVSEQSLDEILAKLRKHSESVEAQVEELEGLDRSITRDELDNLQRAAEELRRARKQVEEALPPESERSAEIDRSTELLHRMEMLAQESRSARAAPEEPFFAPVLDALRAVQFYGSFRGRLRATGDEPTEFDENTSRVGVRGTIDLGSGIEFFGRGEVGLRPSDLVDLAGDPGAREVEEGGTASLRLAFLGFETPFGRLSFGKQWSTYYDVAIFTDQLPYLCCEAHGVYNAGKDGGVSGTGRADRAFQYRNSFGGLRLGLQTQIRSESPEDPGLVDTYGASAVYRWQEVFDVGIAYNEVLDGVTAPEAGQAKDGDRSTILGLRFITDRSYAALTYTTFDNHEKDDLGRFFSGEGVAVYASYFVIPDRLLLGAEWDDLMPDSGHPGEYRVRFVTAGAAYLLRKHWSFLLLYRFENGRLSDGRPRGDETLMVSVHFDF